MRRFEGKKMVFLLAALLLFASCEEKDVYQPKENEKEEEVETGFSELDFSTTNDVQLNISYPVPSGYASAFKLYKENPMTTDENGAWVLDTEKKSISAGIVISGAYNLKKTLPAYIQELYVYSSDLFAPRLMYAKIVNGVADFSIVNLSASAEGVETKANPLTPKYKYFNPDAYLLYAGGATFIAEYPNPTDAPMEIPGGIGPDHMPCVAYHKDIPTDVLLRIASAFPEKQEVNPDFLSDNALYLTEEAEVWMAILTTSGTSFNNSLGYFYYNGTKEELMAIDRSKVNKTDVIAVPFAHLANANSNSKLQSGDYVQLYYYDEATEEWTTQFPAHTTIGFNLRAKAYDVVDSRLTNSWQFALFSLNTLNEGKRHYASLVNAGTQEDPFICFGFEDHENLTYSDRDYNDVMFHIEVSPSSAITEPLPTLPSEEPEIIVGTERTGILAYEDLWPTRGDYDMNDVVIRYYSNATLSYNSQAQQTYLTRLEDTFSVLHSGASYKNQFGYKINVNPALVESITINDEPYTPETDTYKGETGIIIDLCDDIHSVITPYAESAPYDYTIVVTFKDGITEEDFEKMGAPYNPFITTPKPGAEVHLPRYFPTSRADLGLFGTNDDKSNVDLGIFYVSGHSNKYPFALHLSGAESFHIPTEKETIDTTYPRFIDWVESGCTEYTDWYLDY
ncbi:LruC domain-containing protein [Parabacteroides sp. PF5-6]|uniref:LruC domain-containing protein n=1 Tax=Parabacteroides sp. PF5-6 TaxID=1742403 RepID=UPI002405895B|nr:LruC domain-containing protein [Parabacteroides sp. PF5-6]MDF9828917.1 LruC domain-containing protein [Parabacteroides sp. PF5-6]